LNILLSPITVAAVAVSLLLYVFLFCCGAVSLVPPRP